MYHIKTHLLEKTMPSYQLHGLTPVVDPSAYVHASAVLIGDVIISKHCYIGPNAVLRGDFGRIIISEGANVQDTCVIHAFPGKDCIVKQNGHIGHGAILHGCIIGENSLIGMNAVIMDDAIIGAESIIGATAFVKSRFECGPRSLLVGNPAKVLREVTNEEINWKSEGTLQYQQLAISCSQQMTEVTPLNKIENDRPRINFSNYDHKPG